MLPVVRGAGGCRLSSYRPRLRVRANQCFDELPGIEGCQVVRALTDADELHGRVVPGIRAGFVGLEVPDRYVFGYGMDFYEQGRNLPGIYALKDDA